MHIFAQEKEYMDMVHTIEGNLPQGFLLRTAVEDDLAALTELVRQCEVEFYGVAETTLADMVQDWHAPNFDPSRDTWVVQSPEGELVGHAWVLHHMHALMRSGYGVHPAYHSCSIETYLLQVIEARALEHVPEAAPGVRVVLVAPRSDKDRAGHHLLETHGFELVRHFWRMAIELNDAPAQAQWPAHIQVRTFTPDMERAVYEADEESFKDHWGHMPLPFEEWQYWALRRHTFDPSLWFLAMDGNEIAGFALCADEGANGGWVNVLGVRRPWRRQGIALNLLYHAFTEFYRRGIKKIYLSVDAQSFTGATRLYERAGMHIDQQSSRFEKELRAGKDMSVRSLDG